MDGGGRGEILSSRYTVQNFTNKGLVFHTEFFGLVFKQHKIIIINTDIQNRIFFVGSHGLGDHFLDILYSPPIRKYGIKFFIF